MILEILFLVFVFFILPIVILIGFLIILDKKEL